MELGAAFVAMLEIFMSPTQLPFKHFNLVLTVDIGLQFFFGLAKESSKISMQISKQLRIQSTGKGSSAIGG